MALLDRSLVSSLPIFKGWAPEDLDEVLREARSHSILKNEPLFEQGAAADRFFLLLHGHLRVIKGTPDGDQVVIRFIGPGELCGIAMAIGRTTYPATALAAADSIVLAWPSAAWPRLAGRYPSLTAATLHTVGSRLQEAHTRVVEMSTEEVQRRVARAILRLAQQAGRKVEAGIQIDFPLSRQDIAAMTGTTLHTVSRILSAWEDQGLVGGGRQRIVVQDAHRLLLLAEGGAE